MRIGGRSSIVRVLLAVAGLLGAALWSFSVPISRRPSDGDVASETSTPRRTRPDRAASRVAVPDDAPAPNGMDPSVDEDSQDDAVPATTTAELLTRIADVSRRELSNSQTFPELHACTQQHGLAHPACRTLLDRALERVHAAYVAPALAIGQELSIAGLLAQRSAQAVAADTHAAAMAALRGSDDPVLRASTLALAERTASEASHPAPAFPADVYAGLATRTSVERDFLLKAYEQAPVPGLEADLATIATSTEKSLAHRRSALRCLGAAQAAPDLERALVALERASSYSEVGATKSIGPALARCGVACTPTWLRLAHSQDPNARLAVLVGLGQARGGESRELKDKLVEILKSRDNLSTLERDQLAFVSR